MRRPRRRWLAAVSLAVLATPTLVGTAAADTHAGSRDGGTGGGSAAGHDGPRELFRFDDPEITESSGVAVGGRRGDRVAYTHNDSGGAARFFAVGPRGCTLARYALSDTRAVDWEDMARAPGHGGDGATLWFGDIGDNFAERAHVTVHRVREPDVTARDSSPDTGCPAPEQRPIEATGFDLRYPDGPHDAETLLVHPRTGRLFVVTKGYHLAVADDGSIELVDEPINVYAAPRRLRRDGVTELRKVTTLDLPAPPQSPIPGLEDVLPLATGGDIAPDAGRVIVRTYTTAYEWRVPRGSIAAAFSTHRTRVELPEQARGEAIGYTRRGTGVVLTSEDTETEPDPPAYLVPRRD